MYPTTRRPGRIRGFTLIEVLLAAAIASFLLGIAVLSFRNVFKNSAITINSSDLKVINDAVELLKFRNPSSPALFGSHDVAQHTAVLSAIAALPENPFRNYAFDPAKLSSVGSGPGFRFTAYEAASATVTSSDTSAPGGSTPSGTLGTKDVVLNGLGITTLTGSGANALAARETATLTSGTRIVIGIAGDQVLYELADTTGPQALPDLVQPNDFSGSNQRMWRRRFMQDHLRASNNLADLTNAASARSSLGLGSISVQNASNVSITGGAITLANGGLSIGTQIQTSASAMQLGGKVDGALRSATSVIADGSTIGAGVTLSGGREYTVIATNASAPLGAGYLVIADTTSGAYRLVMDASGHLALGGAFAPTATLSIKGDGTNPILNLITAGGATPVSFGTDGTLTSTAGATFSNLKISGLTNATFLGTDASGNVVASTGNMDGRYVQKAGDTMTGQLNITTNNAPPLKLTNLAAGGGIWEFRPYILGSSNAGFSLYDVVAGAVRMSFDASGRLTVPGAAQFDGTISANAIADPSANNNIANWGQLDAHAAYQDFNTVPSRWGWTYVQNSANGPHSNSAQWYRSRVSLGNPYGIGTTSNSYWMEMAVPRYGTVSNGLWIRTAEGGVPGAWYQVGTHVNGNVVLHAGNYSSYTPKLDGTGATGTWPISVTGSAAQLGGISSNRVMMKRRLRISAVDGTSLDSSITAPEMGFNYATSSGVNGPFMAFGGLGGDIDYSCQLNADYSGGGSTFKFRTMNGDTVTWNPWHTLLHSENFNGYAPKLDGTGATGTWPVNVSGNAATVTAVTSGQVSGALGYTPANRAGDTFTGSVAVNGRVSALYNASQVRAARATGTTSGLNLMGAIGDSYISTGTYYNGSAWVHDNTVSANSSMLQFTDGSGARWYASSNSSATWNVASNAQLWDQTGKWTGAISSTSIATGLGYTPANRAGDTFTGNVTAPVFISNVATGTAPFTVSSTTMVNNLNVQYLNGQTGSFYQNASNLNAGTISTSVTATTQAKSDASTQIATTAYVKSLFSTAGTAGVADWNDVSNTLPGVGTTLLLGNASNGPGAASYFHPFNLEYSSMNGTGNVTQMAFSYGTPGNEFYMRGRYLGTWGGWVRFLNSANYTLFTPSLTGGGASGTWSISVTGTSANVTGVVAIANGGTGATTAAAARTNLGVAATDGTGATGNWPINVTGSAGSVAFTGVTGKPTTISGYGITDFVSSSGTSPVAADAVTTNGLYYTNANISLFGQADGALYAQAYGSAWIGEIYQDYRTGQLAVRGKNAGTWQPWRTVLDSGNFNSYAPKLDGTGATGSWNITANNSSHLAIVSGGAASTWNWAGQTGQPTWLWGSNNGTDMYVWNPTNFVVTGAHGMAVSDGTTLNPGMSSTRGSSGSRSGTLAPNTYQRGIFAEFKDSGFATMSGNYGGLITFAPYVGASSAGEGNYQLLFSPAGANSTAAPTLRMRAGIDTTWGAWTTVYTSANLTKVSQLTNDTGFITGISSAMVTGALGYTPSQSASSVNSIISSDTRSTNFNPQDRAAGLYADFRQNTVDGLVDGGSFHGVLTFRPYGSSTDFTGGVVTQIAVSDNGNLWTRTSTGATTWSAWKQPGSAGSTANPTAVVGLTAVNGSASTFMRSDAAPPLSQAIVPNWTGLHSFKVTNNASSASASNAGMIIAATVAQSGTADFRDLLINRTNTSVGSGSQFLIDAQVNSSSVFKVDTSGSVVASAYNSGSSKRWKEHEAPLTGMLEKVLKLRPLSYDWKPGFGKGGHDIGFFAEEMNDVFPEVVSKDKEGQTQGLDYGRLTAVLAAAIQEMNSRDTKRAAEQDRRMDELLAGLDRERGERRRANYALAGLLLLGLGGAWVAKGRAVRF